MGQISEETGREAFMRVLGIVGYSGNGKTHLMTRLIPALTAQGVTVSTIKHTHHSVRVDDPHDISRRLTDAGAVDVAIAGHERWALLHENDRDIEPLVEDLVARMAPVDLVLVEGFKHHPHPKIEVHRPAAGKPLLCREDSHVIAVATDGPLPMIDLPVLDLNDPPAIAAFILDRMELSGR
jgi:molybdopterin-guanine dinucleotide biosynthesis protein B